MKPVLIDTSSAILLFKAGLIDNFLYAYDVRITQAVFSELTQSGYEGEKQFRNYVETGVIRKIAPFTDNREPEPPFRSLDAGERETILAYLIGHGNFIVIDDKKAASYLRTEKIPYINALLVPRLLYDGQRISDAQYQTTKAFVKTHGRYAGWVIEYAENCPSKDLSHFLPV